MSKASQKPCLRPFETLGLAEEKEKEEDEEKKNEKKKEEGKEEEVLEEEQEKVFNKFDIGFQAWLRNLTQVQLSGKRWDAVRLESKFKPSACRGRQMS